MSLSYLLTEGARDLPYPSQRVFSRTHVSQPPIPGFSWLHQPGQCWCSLPWEGPRFLIWMITAVTLLRGAACKLIFLVGRNSQEGHGDFTWTLKDGGNSASQWWGVGAVRGPRSLPWHQPALALWLEARGGVTVAAFASTTSGMMPSSRPALLQVMRKSVGRGTLETVLAFESLSYSPVVLSWSPWG